MDTKEAIKLLENDQLLDICIIESYVALLKRGEKYEKMWKNLEKAFKPMSSFFIGETIWANIDNIKQKYFPKGGK